MQIIGFDHHFDLGLQRTLPLSKEQVWAALTNPDMLKQWFYPKPWQVINCIMDIRPAGEFSLHVQSPTGHEDVLQGCFLEVLKEEKLVWTRVLSSGYRPTDQSEQQLDVTVIIHLNTVDTGTQISVHTMHGSMKEQQEHAQLGFHERWSSALDQLTALYQQHEAKHQSVATQDL